MYRAERRMPGARKAGFTLAELMIGVSVSSFIMLGVLSTFLMLLRSGIRASNYSVMETQARRTFEQLGIDLRMASGVASTTAAGSSTVTRITLTVPNNYVANSNQVTYGYDSTNKYVYLVPGNGSAYVAPGSGTAPTGQVILLSNVTSCSFNRYDQTGAATTSDASTRHVQAAITVKRTNTGTVDTTESILSAAFTLRN